MLKRKLAITGFLIITAIAVFIWGINYLKGQSVWKKKRTYYAVYDQVGGLNIGSPVTFKGLKIGQINSIDFLNETGTELIVSFVIDRKFHIPLGSKAQIFNADIIGTKGLRIIPSDSKEFYHPGDTLKSSIEMSMFDDIANNLGPLRHKSEHLIGTLDTFTNNLNEILYENQNNLDNTLKNIHKITSDLAVVSEKLKFLTSENGQLTYIMNDLQVLADSLHIKSSQISNSIQNISDISDSLQQANLKQTVQNLNKAVNSLNKTITAINSGQGTLGKLVYQDSLYNSLDSTIIQLDSLIGDIRKNPHQYLRFSVIDMSNNASK